MHRLPKQALYFATSNVSVLRLRVPAEIFLPYKEIRGDLKVVVAVAVAQSTWNS